MNYQKKLTQYQLDIKEIQLLAQKAFGLQMCEDIFWTNKIQFEGATKQQINFVIYDTVLKKNEVKFLKVR